MTYGIKKSHLVLILMVSALLVTSGCIGGNQTATGADDNEGTQDTSGTEDTGAGDGEETTTEATSLDVTVSGYEDGEMKGSMRIKARELDAERPDLRAEKVDGEQVFIYNNDEEVGYLYEPNNDQWIQASGTVAYQFTDPFIKAARDIRDVVDDYGVGNTATLSYGGESGEFTKNAENPSFSDDIFKPPEGANVQQNIPMQ